MKNKNILIGASVVISALLVWLFWPEIKAMLAKKENPDQQDENNTNHVNTQQPAPVPVPVTTKPISIGDSVVAAKDLVKAFDEKLKAVVRTYKKGNYIGVVKKDNNGWLTVSDTSGAIKQIQKINVKRFQP